MSALMAGEISSNGLRRKGTGGETCNPSKRTSHITFPYAPLVRRVYGKWVSAGFGVSGLNDSQCSRRSPNSQINCAHTRTEIVEPGVR